MQIFGAIICLLAAARLIQSIVSASQRHAALVEQAIMDEQIAAAKALRVQCQQQSLHWNGFRKFRVREKVTEADNVCSLYLIPHDARPLPSFRPGQYLTFRFSLPGSRAGENKPVVRCYSLSDAPRPDHFRITVKRVPPPDNSDAPPGRISGHILDNVRMGDILDVQAPRGEFTLDPYGTGPAVLIAGGVGVTPLLSMVNAVAESGSGRVVWFFYGVRNGTEHAMRQQLDQIVDRFPNVRLHVCYSRPREDDRQGTDYQEAGHISIDVVQRVVKVPNYEFYVCGPPSMMDSLVPALKDWGVPKERIHTEAFGPATVSTAAPKQKQNGTDNKSTPSAKIQFSRSGREIEWDRSAGNILDLALRNDIPIESGCRVGSCGTCVVAVKRGRTSYNTEPDAECSDGSCLTCVSVPDGDLVLDA